MSGENSSSESQCNTGRSSTNTSNSTPRSGNTTYTPRTNSSLHSAYNTPRESFVGISSTSSKKSNKYDESLIPKYYSQLLELRNGSVAYNTLGTRDKVTPPVRKVCRRLGVKKLSEISSDDILYKALVDVIRENNNASADTSTCSNLSSVIKLPASDVSLIEILKITVARLMKIEEFQNSSNDIVDNYIYYDPVNDYLTSTPSNTTVASVKLPSISYIIAINLFWEKTSTLFKSICSNSYSYSDCFDLFFELIVIILSVGKLDPISMYAFLGPLDLITQRMMYELSDKVVVNSIYSSQLLPHDMLCREYYDQFVAVSNIVSKPLQEYINSFIKNDIAQYSITKSATLSRQLLEQLCWCSSYHQRKPPLANISKSININDLLIKFLGDDYNITVDNRTASTWLGISEHMRVTLSSLLSVSKSDLVSASLLDCTGITSLGIFGISLFSHMQSDLLRQCNSNIVEFSLSLNENDIRHLAQNDNNCRREQGTSSRHFKSLLKDTRSTCESLMASLMSHIISINNSMKRDTNSRDDLKICAKRNADMSLLCQATDKYKVDEAVVLNPDIDSLKVGSGLNIERMTSLITKLSNDLLSFGYSSQCPVPPFAVDSDKTKEIKLPLVVHLQDIEGLGTYGIISTQPLGCTITYYDLSYDMICMSLRRVTNDTNKLCISMKLFISLVLLFAKQHKLIEFTGGLLSVSAILHLIVYFLLRNSLIQIDNTISGRIMYKLNHTRELDGESIEWCDPITLFHKFCYFYSFEFNIFDDIVSVTTDRHVHKSLKSQYRSCVMWRLYVEDISNITADMGTLLTRNGQIQLFKAFRRGAFATHHILQSMESQAATTGDMIPQLFDNRMLNLALDGGYKGANVSHVPILNQLICERFEANTNCCHRHLLNEETTRKKVDIETKVVTTTNSIRLIASSSNVVTNIATSGVSTITINDNGAETSIIKSTVRYKPFIPKLAISEAPLDADLLEKILDTSMSLNTMACEPGSGHTDRSISSISSQSDADISSARSIDEFNSLIDHITSTAASLSDNISGRNSARGTNTTAITAQETRKTPRLVRWSNKK